MYYISYISYPIYTSNIPNAFCPFFRLAFKTTLLDLVLDASHKGLVPPKIGEFNSFNFNFPSVTSSQFAQIPTKMGKKNMGSLCFTQSVEPFRYFLGNLEEEALKFMDFMPRQCQRLTFQSPDPLHLPAKII